MPPFYENSNQPVACQCNRVYQSFVFLLVFFSNNNSIAFKINYTITLNEPITMNSNVRISQDFTSPKNYYFQLIFANCHTILSVMLCIQNYVNHVKVLNLPGLPNLVSILHYTFYIKLYIIFKEEMKSHDSKIENLNIYVCIYIYIYIYTQRAFSTLVPNPPKSHHHLISQYLVSHPVSCR